MLRKRGNSLQIMRLLAAVDPSPEGLQAAHTGARLASAAAGDLLVLAVVDKPARPPVAGRGKLDAFAADRLLREVEARLRPDLGTARARYRVGSGVPAVEIARLADQEAVDLIVLGRKWRTRVERWVVGDTADATARRARVPCLFVHAEPPAFGRILAAVDAGPATRDILQAAFAVSRIHGGKVLTLHVERPPGAAEAAAPRTLTMRHAEFLTEAAREVLQQESEAPPTALAVEGETEAACDILVRQGDPVDEILKAVREEGIDLLVIGHHRGGPPGGGEAACTAPRLLHRAPCAVLTVPL